MARRFENYIILAEIGRGGMGIVYKAVDERTGKEVAIKQLILDNIDANKHKEFRDRFRREAQTALRLVHKNVVSVLDISSDPDSYYYVMEFLEGHSLRREIAKHGGKCSPDRFLNILEQIAEGLSYAHSMNVIHRDVKPDNIFILEDGTVKITDFGIARVADLEETNLTKTGVMLGTLAYVSPEQLQNAKTVDHRADIFSLGVVSYEALCGYLPFTGDGIAATIVKIMSQEEIPLTSMNPLISPELSGAVSRALRKKPRDRYRSVHEFIRDFRSAFESTMGGGRRFDENIDPLSTTTDISVPLSAAITPADINQEVEAEEQELLQQQSQQQQFQQHSQQQKFENPAGPETAEQAPESESQKALMATQDTLAGGIFGKSHSTGDLEEQRLPDTTLASADMADFGLKVSLDKGGVLKDKPKSRFTTSGKYRPLNGQEKPKLSGDVSQEMTARFLQEPPGYLRDSGAQRSSAADDSARNRIDERTTKTPDPTAQGPSAAGAGNPGFVESRMQKTSESSFMPTHYNPIKLMMTIKTQGPNEKTLTEPTSTCYRSGRLLVADSAMRVVHMFSLNGRWLCDLTHRPEVNSKTGGGRFTKPSGIAIDERSRIYVSDSSDQYIRIFDGQGLFIKEFKNIQGGDGGLAGICIDSTGLLYVSDSTNGTLQVFQSDLGVWVRSIGTKGNEPGQLQLPSGLATDRLNRVYVVDYGTSRVSVFNKSGALVRTFGSKGNQRGMFNVPRAIAIDKHDRIFVLDSLNHRIQVFGQGGDWLYTFGGLGSGPDEFVGPSGLSIDNENSLLFVADKGNKRIQVLELGFK
jgi:serine/threonine protein kinase/DNA-binding beta-propeller fold protein YncE